MVAKEGVHGDVHGCGTVAGAVVPVQYSTVAGAVVPVQYSTVAGAVYTGVVQWLVQCTRVWYSGWVQCYSGRYSVTVAGYSVTVAGTV